MARAREPLSFAQQLDRLEEIVRRLETQELDLDEALKLFEEGIERLREARERLTPAEAQATPGLRRGDGDPGGLSAGGARRPRARGGDGRTRPGAGAPPRDRPRAVPCRRRGGHDRRAGTGPRGGGAAAPGREPRGRAPAEDGRLDRRRVRDRRSRRWGAARGVRSAPRLRRGRGARIPDLRRRARRHGDLGSARQDRGKGRGIRQVDVRHPARRRRRAGGGGAARGAGRRPAAAGGVSFSYAGGAGALHCYETELKYRGANAERESRNAEQADRTPRRCSAFRVPPSASSEVRWRYWNPFAGRKISGAWGATSSSPSPTRCAAG